MKWIACYVFTVGIAFGQVLEQAPVVSGGFSVQDGANIMEVADSFVLSSGTSIEKVQWWGGTQFQSQNNFVVRFYSDQNGVPGQQLFVATVNAGLPITIGPTTGAYDPPVSLSSYSAVLPAPFTIAANQKYWLSISSANPGWEWQISEAASPYGVDRRDLGDSWDNPYGKYGDHAAFALYAAPEPTVTWLLSAGAFVLVFVRVKPSIGRVFLSRS